MRLEGSKLVAVGGAGLIGSHTVDALLREGVAEMVVFELNLTSQSASI